MLLACLQREIGFFMTSANNLDAKLYDENIFIYLGAD